MVIYHLDASFSENKRPEEKYRKLEEVKHELSVLLSALCHTSGGNPEEGWSAAMLPLEGETDVRQLTLLSPEDAKLPAVDRALRSEERRVGRECRSRWRMWQ